MTSSTCLLGEEIPKALAIDGKSVKRRHNLDGYDECSPTFTALPIVHFSSCLAVKNLLPSHKHAVPPVQHFPMSALFKNPSRRGH